MVNGEGDSDSSLSELWDKGYGVHTKNQGKGCLGPDSKLDVAGRYTGGSRVSLCSNSDTTTAGSRTVCSRTGSSDGFEAMRTILGLYNGVQKQDETCPGRSSRAQREDTWMISLYFTCCFSVCDCPTHSMGHSHESFLELLSRGDRATHTTRSLTLTAIASPCSSSNLHSIPASKSYVTTEDPFIVHFEGEQAGVYGLCRARSNPGHR